MNDREQARVLGNLSVGVLGGVNGSLFVFMLSVIEPFGLGSVMSGLAGAMSAAMVVASLLLVRQQLTSWDTETNIELLRSRRQGFLLIAMCALQYHNIPGQWQSIAAVLIAVAAAFATIRLSHPPYQLARTLSKSQQTQA